MLKHVLVPSLARKNSMAISTRSLNIGLDIVGSTVCDLPFRSKDIPLKELELA